MNSKEAKKIRKSTKHTFIIFLREKPRFMPSFIWRLCALSIFNDDGIKLIGGIYGINRFVVINGVKYKIKN